MKTPYSIPNWRFPLTAVVKFSRRACRNAPDIALRGSAAALALFALFGFNPQALAAVDTWTGATGTDWATATNWAYSTGSGPVATGDSLVFTNTNTEGTATLTDTLTSSSFLLAGITFNAPAIGYTTTGNAFELTGNILDSSTNAETIDNAISEPATETYTVVSGGDLTLGGAITGAGGITLNGLGTVTLNAANGYTGATTLNNGTLALNFAAGGAPTTNIISQSSVLGLGGGTLSVVGSSASSSQAFASTTLNAGRSVASATGSATVALGAITYNAGGMVEFVGPATSTAVGTGTTTLAATGTITTTTEGNIGVNLDGIMTGSGSAAVSTVGLYDWATTNLGSGGAGTSPYTVIGGSQVTGFYTTLAGTVGALGVNYNVTGNSSSSSATTYNGTDTLRFNTAAAITFTVQTFKIWALGGILVTPNVGANNVTMVTGGSTGGNGINRGGTDSIGVWQNNTSGELILNSASGNPLFNGSGGYFQAGPGTVLMEGANGNGYTGANYLNGGVTEITLDNELGGTAASNVNLNGGTLLGGYTGNLDNGTTAHPVVLGNGGGLAAAAGNTFTIDGVVSGATGTGPLIIGLPTAGGLVPGTGTGTPNAAVNATGIVVLSNAGNTYTGGTVLDSGTLQLASGQTTANLGTGSVTLNGGGFEWSSNTTDISSLGVVLTSNGGTLDTNGNNVTFANPITSTGAGTLTVQNSSGTGSLTLNGANTFSGPVTVNSGAALAFGGANFYTGATSVNGSLTLKQGSSLANTAITVASGGTLTGAPSGNGNITIGTTGATLTLSAGSTLSLTELDSDTTDTLTLNGVGAATGTVLSVGGATPAALNFELSSNGSGELVINDGVTAFGADGGKIFITDLDTNTPASSYTLVSDPNGGLAAGGVSAGADFWLGTTGLTLGGQNYALSLTSSGTSLVLHLTLNTPNYYWTGATSSWGVLSNFATSATGGSPQGTPLGATSNVFLTANSATNFTQTLDGNYIINSLSFTGAGTSAAGNSIILADGSGTALTINAANSFVDSNLNSYAAGTGLVVQPGSDAQTISANINLGNSQGWFVNNSPSTPLTVSGVIADAVAGSGDALTKSGTGTLILANAETYDGGTVVTAGTVQLRSGASLLATGALTVSGTGTFDLNGNSQSVGSLWDGGVATGIITSSTGTGVLTLNNSSTVTFGGTITDAGTPTNGVSLSLTLNGPGNVTLSGSNSYNGLTTLDAGNLTVANNYALGNSTAANGGLTIANSAGTSSVNFTSLTPTIASLNSSTSVASNVILGNTAGSGSATTLNVGGAGGISTFTGTISDLTGTKATAIGNLNVFGGGLLILTAANTFTGVTTITGSNASFASELELQNAGALENSTLNYNNQGGTINFSTLGAVTLAGLTGSQNLALTNQSGTALALTIGNLNVGTTFTGNLGGLGSLTKEGSGTFQVGSGAVGGASYAGSTTVSGGTLILGGTTSLGGTITVNQGTLTVQDNATIVSTSGLIMDNLTGNPAPANLTLSATGSLTVASFTFGNNTRANGTVTIQNSASMTVNGAYDVLDNLNGTTNAEATTTSLNGGTLAVQNFTYVNSGASANSLATINLNGGTLEALASDPTASQFIPAFAKFALNVDGGGAIVNTDGHTDTIAQPLVHAAGTPDGGLTVEDTVGTGILTLLAGETYTGATTINSGGTLQLGNGSTGEDGTITTSSGITDNGTLIYNRFGPLSSSLVISGSGNVQVSGPGSQTLLAVNSFTGSTTINAGGTLQLGNGTAGNDGTITTSSGITDNGTLIYDRSGALASGVVISGSGNVVVEGSGSQTLTATNTYTGATSINAGGTLQLGDGTAGNDGTIEDSSGITDGGNLIYDRSGSLTSGLAITGAGNVEMTGTGTENLSASSNFTGATTVNQGRLIVSGSLTGTTAVSVASGAHLEVDGLVNNSTNIAVTGFLNGTGSVGPFTVASNGTLGPGRSTLSSSDAGTLTVNGNVVLTDTSSLFSVRLGAGGSSDQLALDPGDLVSLNNATLKLTLDPDFAQQVVGFIYVLINGGTASTGDISGEFEQGTQITDAIGDQYNILYNVNASGVAGAGDDVDLQLTAIPEPGTWAMILSGMGVLGLWRRSRRACSRRAQTSGTRGMS